MEIINDDLCKLRIVELFLPISDWFMREEECEFLELNVITQENYEKDKKDKNLALSQKKEIIQYINSFSHNFPNRDIMLLIIKELYLYLEDTPNYNINQWNLVRSFNQFLI